LAFDYWFFMISSNGQTHTRMREENPMTNLTANLLLGLPVGMAFGFASHRGKL
jgi:hypothetical protein